MKADRAHAGKSARVRDNQALDRSQTVESKDGEMSEWLKEHAWKARVGELYLRFESRALRRYPPSRRRVTAAADYNPAMTRVSRRRLLQSTGGFAAVAALRGGTLVDAAPSAQNPAVRDAGDVTGRLARYMVASRDRALPEAVALDPQGVC
jgi:hypothetical protein